MKNQQNEQQQNQRVQQLEEVAKHYTNAASALRDQNEEACTSCIKKAEEAAQKIQRPKS